MKQMIINICKIFPAIILKKDMLKKIKKSTVPKHGNLNPNVLKDKYIN